MSRSLAYAIAAGLAGWLVNGYFLRFRDDLLFVFGGVFAMLVVVLDKPAHGVLAAGLASSRTVFAWMHPVAVVASVVEAASVGTLVRRGWSALPAAVVFWGARAASDAGAMMALFYQPQTTAWTIAIKYARQCPAEPAPRRVPADDARRRPAGGPALAAGGPTTLRARILKAFFVVPSCRCCS